MYSRYILEQDRLNHLRGTMWNEEGSIGSPTGALGIVAIIAGVHPLCEDIEDMKTELCIGAKPRFDTIELTVWWKEND